MDCLRVRIAGRQWTTRFDWGRLAEGLEPGAVRFEGSAGKPVGPAPEDSELLHDVALRWKTQLERAWREHSRQETHLRQTARAECERFALAVHLAAPTLHCEEACELARRLLGAAHRAHENAAEGCGRTMPRDCLFFLHLAQTHLEEAAHLIDRAARLCCLGDETTEQLLALRGEATRALDELLSCIHEDLVSPLVTN